MNNDLAFPKPEKRKTTKARLRRKEKAVIGSVRAEVTQRDGYCRLYWLDNETRQLIWRLFGRCAGNSEWAHLGKKRRAHTVGMDPEERHVRTHTAMLCTCHHRGYDARDFDIEFTTDRGADGPLKFTTIDGEFYQEATT